MEKKYNSFLLKDIPDKDIEEGKEFMKPENLEKYVKKIEKKLQEFSEEEKLLMKQKSDLEDSKIEEASEIEKQLKECRNNKKIAAERIKIVKKLIKQLEKTPID